MADYYTFVSLELEAMPEWDIHDIDAILNAIGECDLDEAPEWYKVNHPCIEEGIDFETYVENYLDGAFGSVKREISDRALWIYSEEYGNISHISHAIHETMKHYNTPGFVTFEWAYSASKPMLDAYGGGAAFITAEQCLHHTTGDWLREIEKAHTLEQKESGDGTRKAY